MHSPLIISSIFDLQQLQRDWANQVTALVPTMGNLHSGHRALVEEAKRHADKVMLYIYVNPAQFAPHEDYSTYPRTLERDMSLCRDWGVDAVFTPSDAMIYPEGKQNATQILPAEPLNNSQYALMRPDFFQGVTTVLARMFNLIQPNLVVFGYKDAQQFAIVRRMIRDLFMPIAIVGVPTVREEDGLAMSSRNQYLKSEDRPSALLLSQILRHTHHCFHQGESNTDALKERAWNYYRTFQAQCRGSHFELAYLELLDLTDFTAVSPPLANEHFHIVAAGTLNGVYLIDCLGLSEPVIYPELPIEAKAIAHVV
jgi:pantoate--beta-alanine ligase